MSPREESMANDESREPRDERRVPRSGGGSRADRAERARKEAEERAEERSVIPGPRSFGGANIASTEDEQTSDHTSRRGPGPHDDVQLSDHVPPDRSDGVERKD
jgi:hypothetical protein